MEELSLHCFLKQNRHAAGLVGKSSSDLCFSFSETFPILWFQLSSPLRVTLHVHPLSSRLSLDRPVTSWHSAHLRPNPSFTVPPATLDMQTYTHWPLSSVGSGTSILQQLQLDHSDHCLPLFLQCLLLPRPQYYTGSLFPPQSLCHHCRAGWVADTVPSYVSSPVSPYLVSLFSCAS